MTTVVHIITALERGGAQRVVLECAAELSNSDATHHVITGDENALGAEARQRLGCRLHVENSLRNPISRHDLRALFALSARLSRIRDNASWPFFVHTHGSKAGVLGRLAGRSIPSAKIVHTVHGFGLDALGGRYRAILLAAEKLAGAATDAMVFVNEADAEQAKRWRLAPRASHHIVRAGIPAQKYRAFGPNHPARQTLRDEFGIANGAPLVVSVANLKPQKDPLFHLQAFAAFRRYQPEAQYLFLGDGPLRSQMQTQAKKLGLADALHLPGFWSEPGPALAAADVFMLASAWEGLPCSVLEAHCAGLPIALRAGSWADALQFPSAIYRTSEHASPNAVAEKLNAAWTAGRGAPRTLPPSFTQTGMLADYRRLYETLGAS